MAQAASAPPIPVEARALTHARGGAIEGCGVRLTGGEPGRAVSVWFDVSFNLFASGPGIAQAMAYEIRRSEEGESAPALVPLQRTWLAPATRSTRLGENVERSYSLVYTLLEEDVLALFEAVGNGEPVTLGIRPWGQPADSVYTAVPVVAAEGRSRIGECLAGLKLR